MKKRFFSSLYSFIAHFLRYALFFCNVALLIRLGIETVQLWLGNPTGQDSYNFFDIMAAFPSEPEFIDRIAAEKQFWMVQTFKTIVYVFGIFFCYEILVRRNSVRRNLMAPMFIAFIWISGESASYFMPALDKAHAIRTCQSIGITWNPRTHRCNLMDLERQRLRQLTAEKKEKELARKKAIQERRAAARKAAIEAAAKKKAEITAKTPVNSPPPTQKQELPEKKESPKKPTTNTTEPPAAKTPEQEKSTPAIEPAQKTSTKKATAQKSKASTPTKKTSGKP